MIPVGSRWALMWKAPHRIELEVIELTADVVVVESVHRCGFDWVLRLLPGSRRASVAEMNIHKPLLPALRGA